MQSGSNVASHRAPRAPARRCTSRWPATAAPGNRAHGSRAHRRCARPSPIHAGNGYGTRTRRTTPPASPNRILRPTPNYTVEAASTEDSSASSEPAMLNSTAHTGTPRKFVLANRAGISRSLASDHTMREHHHNEHGRPHPGRRMRKPSLHQQPGRRELRCERHRPVQPIQDSNGERGAGADEPLRIHVEAAGIRHGHGQFAQRDHHTVDEQGADRVSEDRAQRPRLMNRIAGADEQAGTDYAAQGDHRQVARLHFPFQAGIVLGCAGCRHARVSFGRVNSCVSCRLCGRRSMPPTI